MKAMARRLRRLIGALLVAVCVAAPLHAETPSVELKGLQETTAALYKAGNYPAALAVAERAVPLVIGQYGAESEEAAIHYYSLGLIGEAGGTLAAAAEYFARSAAIREKVYGPDDAKTADALQKLGNVYVKLGQLGAAEQPLRRALKIRQELTGVGTPFTASPISDLAALSLARGDWPTALEGYREAIRLIIGQDTSRTILRAINEEEIGRQRETFVGLSRAAWQLRGSNSTLLEEAFAAGQLAAITSAGAALAKMTARLSAGDSDLGLRIRHLQDVTERILRLYDVDQKQLAGWSTVQRADPTYSALLAEYRAAAITLGRERAPAFKRQRELVTELTQLQRCVGKPEAAGCEESEIRRTAVAKELEELGTKNAAGSGAITALYARMEAAEQALPGYREFTSTRAALRNDIDNSEREARTARAGILAAFPRYSALAEPKPLTIAQAQGLLFEDEALIAILCGSEKSFVWAITRERADWAELGAGSGALTQAVARLRRGLDPLAQQNVEDAAGSRAGFDMLAAHDLYRQVLGPVAATFAAKRHLIIVPTGPLTSLPFQVLLTEQVKEAGPAPSATALRTAPWLIARHALSVLPTVPSLIALRQFAKTSRATKPYLGVGDPLLDGQQDDPVWGAENKKQADLARTKRCSHDMTLQLMASARGPRSVRSIASLYHGDQVDIEQIRQQAPLPETADEVCAVARQLGVPDSEVLLGAEATETRIKVLSDKGHLADYAIVHFATHGALSGQVRGSAEPGLILTPPPKGTTDPKTLERDDGFLTASEIAALKLDADWVVLSACNTAGAQGEGAEALSGMARAFFYAGARTLLVSHWAVDSASTVKLITKALGVMSADASIGRAEAMRRSMLAMIHGDKAKEAYPAYWAPFVVVGEGSTPSAPLTTASGVPSPEVQQPPKPQIRSKKPTVTDWRTELWRR
jgi:CHAT domain-containing protein